MRSALIAFVTMMNIYLFVLSTKHLPFSSLIFELKYVRILLCLFILFILIALIIQLWHGIVNKYVIISLISIVAYFIIGGLNYAEIITNAYVLMGAFDMATLITIFILSIINYNDQRSNSRF